MILGDIVEEIMEESQMFELDVRPGFSGDDPHTSGLTRVVPRVNRVYRDLVREGWIQCYVQKTLVVDTREYTVPKEMGFVHELTLTDADGHEIDLEVTDRATLSSESRRYKNKPSSTPRKYYIEGNIYGFDVAPDDEYVVNFLADVVPTPLTLVTHEPDRLPELNHDALVTGGTFRLLRMGLNMKDMSEFGLMRFRSHYEEWQEQRRYVRELANSRVLTYQRPLNLTDGYRVYQAGRYR